MATHGEGFEADADYQDSTTDYTCNKTGRALGPDNAAVGMKPCCNDDRDCYEEY